MNANKLIGQKAIRTAPTQGIGDNSHATEPIFIVEANEAHIVYQFTEDGWFGRQMGTTDFHFLNSNWTDDNWTSYDKLMERSKANLKALSIVASIVAFPSSIRRNTVNLVRKTTISVFRVNQFIFGTRS
jgi:hypothetical protein